MYNGVDSRSPCRAPFAITTRPWRSSVISRLANFFILNLFVASSSTTSRRSLRVRRRQLRDDDERAKLWTLRRRNFFGEKGKGYTSSSPGAASRVPSLAGERLEWFIMAVITVNAVAMACEHYQQQTPGRRAEVVSYLCAAVSSPRRIKLIGLGALVLQVDGTALIDAARGHSQSSDSRQTPAEARRPAHLASSPNFQACAQAQGPSHALQHPRHLSAGLGGHRIGSCSCSVSCMRCSDQLFGKVKFGENLNEHATAISATRCSFAPHGDRRGVERHHVRRHGGRGPRRLDRLRDGEVAAYPARRILSPSSSSAPSSRSTSSSPSSSIISATARRVGEDTMDENVGDSSAEESRRGVGVHQPRGRVRVFSASAAWGEERVSPGSG